MQTDNTKGWTWRPASVTQCSCSKMGVTGVAARGSCAQSRRKKRPCLKHARLLSSGFNVHAVAHVMHTFAYIPSK